MISHGKDIKIFCGNSNRTLAEAICRNMGTRLGDMTVTHFSDGEVSLSLYETVRGSDVFLVQSTCAPVNDNLMELLVMIDACRRASAGRITAVMPYFGYARQDRKAKSHDPISAKLVANLIASAGADRVLTRSRDFLTYPWIIWLGRRFLPIITPKCSVRATPASWWSPPMWAVWPAPGISPTGWG